MIAIGRSFTNPHGNTTAGCPVRFVTSKLALPGAGLRGRLCGTLDNCSEPDLWKRRIGDMSEKISSEGFVVNLGISWMVMSR